MHRGIEFTVLYIAIAAAVFVLLSFRVIFPRHENDRLTNTFSAADPHSGKDDSASNIIFGDIFQEHKLSRREIEVAKLMVNEGLDTEEIAMRLFISLTTVKSHISNIYRKFKVNKRCEFMALFVRHLAKDE